MFDSHNYRHSLEISTKNRISF